MNRFLLTGAAGVIGSVSTGEPTGRTGISTHNDRFPIA
jgi:hypothetical protein